MDMSLFQAIAFEIWTDSVVWFWELVIGAWLVFDHWSLVIPFTLTLGSFPRNTLHTTH